MGTCGPSTACPKGELYSRRHFCDAGLLAAHGHILLALDTRHVHSTRGLSHACLRNALAAGSVIGASDPRSNITVSTAVSPIGPLPAGPTAERPYDR